MSRHRTTRWPKEFDARRTPKYKHGARYVDLRIGIGSGSSDLICTFMEDDNYTYAFDEADRVMEFTNGTGLRVQELQEAIGEPGTRQSVWIDDRLCPEPGDPGELLVSQPLQTPTFLYRHLIAKTEALLKDRASRRLIYVSDLDSWEVLSLAATAMWHEAPALRLAISNYFGFQPAIEAKVPSMGFTTFEFLLHLPFFILREKESNGYATRMGGRCGPPRERIDLSFLKMKPPGAKKTWALYQTNFSCAVTGTSDWDWVAYGFGDSVFDGHLHELDPEELENMDQLTSRERPTGYPIGWPRQYWLTVFETRARLSGREWRLVIKVLERQIKQYVRENTATMMRGITSEQDRRHLRGTMTWIVKAKDILQMVRDLLIEWIQAWDGFANSDIGGIDYFLDETSSPSHLDPLLEEIKLIFEGIRRLQGKLDSTRDHCDDYLKLLSLHLSISIESKEAAHPSASYLFSFSHFSAVLIHTLIAVILITWLSRSGENFRYGFPTPASHP